MGQAQRLKRSTMVLSCSGPDKQLATIQLSGECNLRGSVSSQQKFEATEVKALGAS